MYRLYDEIMLFNNKNNIHRDSLYGIMNCQALLLFCQLENV